MPLGSLTSKNETQHSKLAFGKMLPRSSIIAALITEITPLAPSVCPMFDFTEPTYNGALVVLPFPKTAWSAAASIGSCGAGQIPMYSTNWNQTYAHFRSRAVIFNISCIQWIEIKFIVYMPHQLRLRRTTRISDSLSTAILVDSCSDSNIPGLRLHTAHISDSQQRRLCVRPFQLQRLGG